MAQHTVATEITEIFREIAHLPEDMEVDPAATLTDHHNWDSVSQIELIVRTEAKYRIRLTEGDLRECHTLAAFIQRVESRRYAD
ncbi:MAG: acyl carrier protein [Kutzneria sp.]|nr:acyl carrier protein [Kutzneria sp.]